MAISSQSKDALQTLRLRLQKMSDEELLQYGRCAVKLVAVKRVSATPNPQIIHLRETRAESIPDCRGKRQTRVRPYQKLSNFKSLPGLRGGQLQQETRRRNLLH